MHKPKINSNSENALFRKSLLRNPESFWGHHLFLLYSSLSICSGHGFWPLKTGRSPRIDAKVWTINVKSDSALIPALSESGFPHCCIHWNPMARNFTVGLCSFLGSRTFRKKCSSNSVLTCLQDWLKGQFMSTGLTHSLWISSDLLQVPLHVTNLPSSSFFLYVI